MSIKSDEFKLSKYFQFAPFTGSIVESYTDKGAIVNPGSPVIQIMRSDELEIETLLNQAILWIKEDVKDNGCKGH